MSIQSLEAGPDILISYARVDGREFASGIRDRLVQDGFRTWQDVLDMRGGEEWWLQIEEKIQKAAAVVLAVTAGALSSAIVRREWVHARRAGTRVLPVTNDPNIFSHAPRWMQKVDVFILAPGHPDYAKTWERFITQLRALAPRAPIPFMAPEVSPEFTLREREQEELTARFLDSDRANPQFARVVLHGAPGFGKTTLARSLCHEPEIVDAFTGGILWVTVGEGSGGVLAGLNEVVRALTGEQVTFNTVEDAAARFQQTAAYRDCLLVLDDVWDSAQVEPFLGPQQCALLITTRQAENGRAPNCVFQQVGEMQTSEASQTLFNFVVSDPTAPGAADARAALEPIAVRLGEWPLLLNIFGGAMRAEIVIRGRTFNEALHWVSEGLDEAGLTAFDRTRSDDRNLALAKSMEISLRPYSDTERQRLYELSIFQADEPVPERIATRLWYATGGVPDFAASRLLREFGGTFFELVRDRSTQEIILRFHDVLREYLTSQLSPAAHTHTHQQLLTSWKTGPQPWTSVADDGYLYDHLVYHLQAAGAATEMQALFETPHWFEQRFAQRGFTYDGYLEDVFTASDSSAKAAREQIKAGEMPTALALSVRYRLIAATVSSLATNLVPELTVRAVELGLWKAARAVTIAARILAPEERLDTCVLLLSSSALTLEDRARVEKLALEGARQWHHQPAYPLVRLAGCLTGGARDIVVQRAMESAISYPESRAESSRKAEAIARRDYYSAAVQSAHALAAVAHLIVPEARQLVIEQGLSFVDAISNARGPGMSSMDAFFDSNKEKAYVLAAWLPLLPVSLKGKRTTEAARLAESVENEQERAFALSAVAAALPPEDAAPLLDQVWSLTARIDDEPWRALCLSRAAPLLKGDRRREALDLALRNLASDGGLELIRQCAPGLTKEERGRVSDAVRNLPGGGPLLLCRLGLDMTAQEIETALDAALQIDVTYGTTERDTALAALSPYLSADLLQRALEASAGYAGWDGAVVRQISDRLLRGVRVTQVRGEFYNFEDQWRWRPPTRENIERDEDVIALEFSSIASITDDDPRWASQKQAFALRDLIRRLPDHHLDRAWTLAIQIDNGWGQANLFSELAWRFDGERRTRAVSKTLDALFDVAGAYNDHGAAILEKVVELLSQPHLGRVIDVLHRFDEWSRIRALQAVLPYVRGDLADRVLELIRQLTNDSSKKELLVRVPSVWPVELWSAVLDTARSLEQEADPTSLSPHSPLEDVLAEFAPKVEGALAEQLLNAANNLRAPRQKARVLARFLYSSAASEQAVREVQSCILSYLHSSASEPRAAVLVFLADEDIFRQPILDEQTLRRIAKTCVQICDEWQWFRS